ncbi:MAG TPA: glycosyl hydrolase [Solirubrobacterales bacterium]|nr:glycosyl hydrolase [Solirubrobacterales bacterium]
MSWLLRAFLFLALALGSSTAPSQLGAGAAPAQAQEVALGSYVEGASGNPARIDRYSRLLGRRPAIVGLYAQFDYQPFERSQLREIWQRGSLPMVTWEPQSYEGRRYSLKGIAAGRNDPYLRRAADAAAGWGRPILVRFAHEMNGNWYPWGDAGPRRYKKAWRHVVRIFRKRGADNVSWVWTPYANQGGGMPFRGYFPGDRWVDWVGLDGFNWGYGGSDFSFRRIFGASYRSLTRLSSRPVMIGEVGTNPRGKPGWIRGALRSVLRMRRVRALVWFDAYANGVDLRFSSGRRSLRAFRGMARRPRFAMGRRCLVRISLAPGGARRRCG